MARNPQAPPHRQAAFPIDANAVMTPDRVTRRIRADVGRARSLSGRTATASVPPVTGRTSARGTTVRLRMHPGWYVRPHAGRRGVHWLHSGVRPGHCEGLLRGDTGAAGR